MKVQLSSLCLFLLPLLGFSQFDYSLDFAASVDRNTSVISASSGSIETFPQYNLRIGGNINYRISENTFIKSGIRFAEVESRTIESGLRWPSEIGPNGFEPDPTLPRYFDNTFNFSYVAIPLVARYEFRKKKLAFFVEGGFSFHFKVNSEIETRSNVSTTSASIAGTDEGVDIAYVLSGGLNYNVNQIFQLFLQPTIRVIDTNSSMILRISKIRNYGIEFGIRRGFNFADNRNAG